MNFLAHFYLSFDHAGLVVGNYLGDFIKNSDLKTLPSDIRDGVHMHRSIDTFTDRHPLVKMGTKSLHEDFRKYAPVVLDIYFDYLLTKFWSTFNQRTLEEFSESIYLKLMLARKHMPNHLARRVERMTAARWLRNYESYEGLQLTFNFIDKRAKFPTNLKAGSDLLKRKEGALGEIFMDFFPDLVEHAKDFQDRRRKSI